MEMVHQKESGTQVLTLQGRLDAGSAPALEERGKSVITEQGAKLVLDMTGVDYISSAGLRTLLVLAKTAKTVNGALALHSVQPMVREVMEISGFDKILFITADSAAAQALLADA